MHLDTGITELKIPLIKENPAEYSNLLHFINELSQLKETPILDDNMLSSTHNNDLPTLPTIAKEPKWVDHVYNIQTRLTTYGRNPIGRGGIYYLYGLVKCFAYKWLHRIRKDEVNRLNLITLHPPAKSSSSEV